MGEIYAFGVGVPEDLAVGLEWYKRAAQQGHERAQTALTLFADREHMQDYKAQRDRQAAQIQHEQQRIATYSSATVDQLYQTAISGDSEAQMNLGRRYLEGIGVAQDEHLGIQYLAKSALQGNLRALQALQQAATPGLISKGNPEASFVLGRLFAAGQGVPKSDILALAWFRISAKQEYPGAAELVTIYDARVLELLQQAAAAGNPNAFFILGKRYVEPEDGSPADLARGVPFLIRAAGLGNADALKMLENLAQPGWLTDGNADAAYALGEIYAKGISVTADVNIASRWYEIAARQGVTEAQTALATLRPSPSSVPTSPTSSK
jgi:hypothetical protein